MFLITFCSVAHENLILSHQPSLVSWVAARLLHSNQVHIGRQILQHRDERLCAAIMTDSTGSALAYVCLGMLLFVPGAYASAIALGSWLNLRGFRYEQMPQMPRAF
jgi:hypothetical protein